MVTRTGNDAVLEAVGPADNAILLVGDEAVDPVPLRTRHVDGAITDFGTPLRSVV